MIDPRDVGKCNLCPPLGSSGLKVLSVTEVVKI